jgi:predicted nucleic acid-binding protein
VIVDTSGLLAFFNDREPAHEAVRDILTGTDEALVVSPFVVAEVDYLVATRHGVDAELAVLRQLGSEAFEIPEFTTADVAKATRVVERYRDQQIGIADASLVILAARYRTRRIVTLDRRHFTVLKPARGHSFDLLP